MKTPMVNAARRELFILHMKTYISIQHCGKTRFQGMLFPVEFCMRYAKTAQGSSLLKDEMLTQIL
jgi:hypothetical protein